MAMSCVREATSNDVGRMCDILVEVGLCDRRGLAERILETLRICADTCFVSEAENGKVNGLLLACFNGFHLFLSHFAVDPDYQTSGVGKELHAKLETRGRDLGAKGIIADSRLTATGYFYNLGYRLPGAVFLIHDIDSDE